MKKLACVLLVTLAPMIGCDRTPGVRSSQGGGGAANAPATERSPEPSPLGCASIGLSPSPSPTSAPGWSFRMMSCRDWPWDSRWELPSEWR